MTALASLAGSRDEQATADNGPDVPGVAEHVERPLDGALGDAVLLLEPFLRRDRPVFRYLPAVDLPAEDPGELHVEGNAPLEVDGDAPPR